MASTLQTIGVGVTQTNFDEMFCVKCTMKMMVIFCDVLVKGASFMFQDNYIILGCEVDFEVLIILERLFITTGHALINMETRQMKF